MLPNIMKQVHTIKHIKDRQEVLHQKMMLDGSDKAGHLGTSEEMKKLKFQFEVLRQETSMMRSIFTEGRFESLEDTLK